MSYINFVAHGAYPEIGSLRVEKAATSYHEIPQNRNPIVTLTGKYEAEALAILAIKQFNVKENDIRLEKKSRTTGENVFYLREEVLPILNSEFGRYGELYLISQEWQGGRVLYCARRLLDRKVYPYQFLPSKDIFRTDEEREAIRRDGRKNLLADRLALGLLHRLGMSVPSAYTLILKRVAPERV